MIRTLKHSHYTVLALVLGIAGFTGCTVGPNYKRPTVNVSGVYRESAADSPVNAEAQSQPIKTEQAPKTEAAPSSLGDEKWWEVFQDPQLQSLIRTALKNNYDVRIAASRVLQAQAQLGITRADQFPTSAPEATLPASRAPRSVRSQLTKLHRDNLRRPLRGTWIFGESIAAPPKLHAPISSPMNGLKNK